MATIREIEVVQNTAYYNALVLKKSHSPELALKHIIASMKAGMSAEQIAHCEKLASEDEEV